MHPAPSDPGPAEPWQDDPFPDTTPTQWARVRRLGGLGGKDPAELDAGEREALRADLERFVADYRPAIVAVARVRFPGRGEAEAAADDFLAEVCADAKSLRGAAPGKASLRRYLQGWLRNYRAVRQRRDLTHESRLRRGGDAAGVEVADARRPEADLVEREHAEYVRKLVRAAIARMLAAEQARPRPKPIEDTCAFAIARHNGIPLPGDDPDLPPALDHGALADATGITVGAIKNRLTRARELFLQFLERLIRHTVGSRVDLRGEWRWFLGVLGRVYPRLGADAS